MAEPRKRKSTREQAPARTVRRSKPGSTIPMLVGLGVALGVFVVGRPIATSIIYGNKEATTPQNRVEPESPARTNTDKSKSLGGDTLRDRGRKEEKRKAPSAPQGATKAGSSSVTSGAFNQAISQAKATLNEAQFAAAARLYREASLLEAPQDMIEEVRNAATACGVFADVTKGVRYNVEAAGANLYMITLKSGGKPLRVMVTRQDDKNVSFKRANGIGGMFPRSIIKSLEPIDQAARKKEVEREVQDAGARAATEGESLSYYLAAMEALSKRFPKEGVMYLKSAYRMAKEEGTDLASVVREHMAYKLLKQGAWFYSVGITNRGDIKFNELFDKYSGTWAEKRARDIQGDAERRRIVAIEQKLADENRKREEARKQEEAKREQGSPKTPKPTSRKEEEEKPEPPVRNRSGSSNPAVAEGDQEFKQGEELFRDAQSVGSAKKSTKLYKQAYPHFIKAMDTYQKAMKSASGSEKSRIQSRMDECGPMIYWSRKLQRL